MVVAPVMAPRRPCVTRCHRQNAAHTHTDLKSEKDFTNMRLKTKAAILNQGLPSIFFGQLSSHTLLKPGNYKGEEVEGSRASSSHDSSSNSGSFQRGSHFLFSSEQHSTLTMVLSSETWVNPSYPLTIHFIWPPDLSSRFPSGNVSCRNES